MADGFVKIYRKITEHWVWADKPFSKGQAWIDLILQANHSAGKVPQGNELIEVSRGDVLTSTVKLSKRWGWSRHKVMSFLDMLENDQMIIQHRDTKRTYLTLCNYSDYHESSTAEGPEKDIKRTASGHQRDTIKKEKKEKNINISSPKSKSERVFEHDSKPYQCAAYLDRKITEHYPDLKSRTESNLQKWSDAFDKTNRIDKRKWDLIGAVLEFSQKDSFWKKNIRSGDKFRDKFDDLYVRMNDES